MNFGTALFFIGLMAFIVITFAWLDGELEIFWKIKTRNKEKRSVAHIKAEYELEEVRIIAKSEFEAKRNLLGEVKK